MRPPESRVRESGEADDGYTTTRLLRCFPAVKLGTRWAGMSTRSPVFGLRPTRGSRILWRNCLIREFPHGRRAAKRSQQCQKSHSQHLQHRDVSRTDLAPQRFRLNHSLSLEPPTHKSGPTNAPRPGARGVQHSQIRLRMMIIRRTSSAGRRTCLRERPCFCPASQCRSSHQGNPLHRCA